jgi:hypothetical protein
MNVDAGKDGKEHLFRVIADHHLMKMVIIKDSRVDTFCTGCST